MTDNKDKKYPHISVYATAKEVDKWKGLANRQGMTLSDYVHECISQHELFVKQFDNNDTKKIINESPQVAELIAENKRLREKIVELETLKIQQRVMDEAKILDCVTEEWKHTSTIAQQAGLYSSSLVDIVSHEKYPPKDADRYQAINDIIISSNYDVEYFLMEMEEKGIVVSKGKVGNSYWRRV